MWWIVCFIWFVVVLYFFVIFGYNIFVIDFNNLILLYIMEIVFCKYIYFLIWVGILILWMIFVIFVFKFFGFLFIVVVDWNDGSGCLIIVFVLLFIWWIWFVKFFILNGFNMKYEVFKLIVFFVIFFCLNVVNIIMLGCFNFLICCIFFNIVKLFKCGIIMFKMSILGCLFVNKFKYFWLL